MSSLSRVIIIESVTEEEEKKLREQFGYRLTVKGKWSWNGEIIDIESESDFQRFGEDEDFAHQLLMRSNNRI